MPRANTAEDKVRRLQVKLYQAAKQSPARRFHALYDKIYRDDIFASGLGARMPESGAPRG